MNWFRRLVEPRHFVFYHWRLPDGTTGYGNAHVHGPISTVADFERVIRWLHENPAHPPGAVITITGLHRINP